MVRLTPLISILIALLGVVHAQEVGQVFPNVRLPTIDGRRTLSLSDLRGKKVLLIEFASW